jgi:(S)-ureidoglycine aminohydrolase
MKPVLFVFVFIISGYNTSNAQNIPSKVYQWNETRSKKNKAGIERILFSGVGKILSNHSIKGISLTQGKSIHYASSNIGTERFFIVKKGLLSVKLNNQDYVLDKGSVVFVLPGDAVKITNNSENEVQFYEMDATVVEPNQERGQKNGPSFVLNWSDMVFKPHNRGGVRQLFDRQTVMMNRFDIHITTLNPGFKSHEPHTHVNEEIILMIDGGFGEMFIGNGLQTIGNGDVCYLESGILHNITNVGSNPITYFAIQWN